MIILEHNIETGKAVERDATSEEMDRIEIDAAEMAVKAKAVADKESAKAALLERLGITADEAKLLLG